MDLFKPLIIYTCDQTINLTQLAHESNSNENEYSNMNEKPEIISSLKIHSCSRCLKNFSGARNLGIHKAKNLCRKKQKKDLSSISESSKEFLDLA